MTGRSLHVVMLSDYETLGGAAVAASRLAESLCQHHRVTRLVIYPDGKTHPWDTWHLVPGRPEQTSRWSRFFRGRDELPRNSPQALLCQALEELKPNIINVHNLHSGTFHGWGPELVGWCAGYAPVVWTLHDMWSFTGRCAYSYDCRQFVKGCTGDCPTALEFPALAPNQILPAWEARQDLLQKHWNLVGVTPSRWLLDQAQEGLWKNQRMELIPYGLPLDVFRPRERDEARRLLGISPQGPVFLVAAHDLTERRKGGPLVPLLWDHVAERPLTLLTMGQGNITLKDRNIQVLPMGWVEDPVQQALLYNAADAVLHPAPVDNLPNVLLEALACGTPAIGFPVGGVPEIIRPGRTGWLAKEASAVALGKTVALALDDLATGKDLRSSCRSWAEEHYCPDTQAQRYSQLFTSLVGKKAKWKLLLRK